MPGDVFICAAKRTPIGSFCGSLQGVSAPDLAAVAMAAVVEEAGVAPDLIDEVILGCVLSAGVGQGPARQAVLAAGFPNSVQALTVNKVCSSGLRAVMLAYESILLESSKAIVAGGMENMSRVPYLLPKLRQGARLGDVQTLDGLVHDGLWDAYNDFHMGYAAEKSARRFGIGRSEQDAFALESYRRAQEAIDNGWFCQEIVGVEVGSNKVASEFSVDEEPCRLEMDRVSGLKGAFTEDGTVTVANSSSISDGAAVVFLCSGELVQAQGLVPLARIVSTGCFAGEPELFGVAPVGAVRNALAKANLQVSDIDLVEINEAFAAVTIACQQQLGLDPGQVNVCGGAVALGHPIGASGARILVTLIRNMLRLDKHMGVATICNGGGEATAVVVELA